MSCPFCDLNSVKPYPYPQNIFNQKKFQYVKCANCDLVYLDPFPEADDYETMYPPSYQSNLVETSVQQDPYEQLPGLRFSYGYQFDLIKKFTAADARILDYGCGTGHFISNANHYGFSADGTEFNSEYVELLRTHVPNSRFYTIAEVFEGKIDAQYDAIRLSNVLEHLTEPKKILSLLSRQLKPNGIFLIEGPIEDNFSPANLFRKFYFKTKTGLWPRKTVSEPPYHIFFSNKKNQQQFFNNCGYTELYFATAENAWPFPASFKQAKGLKEQLMACIALTSIVVSKKIGKNWGNTFIYCGKQE